MVFVCLGRFIKPQWWPDFCAHKSQAMVTRRTSSMKVTPGPAITFGHLIVFIGLCGILFNITIHLNNTTEEVHQGSGSTRKQTGGSVRSPERGKPDYHLNVPFYVYEDKDLNWEDATLNGEPYEPAAPGAGGCGMLRSCLVTESY